jgi:hypothetical protein
VAATATFRGCDSENIFDWVSSVDEFSTALKANRNPMIDTKGET